MNENTQKTQPPSPPSSSEQARLRLLARLRQDQLEAALAGRLAESAMYATEAKLLREQIEKQRTIFVSA